MTLRALMATAVVGVAVTFAGTGCAQTMDGQPRYVDDSGPDTTALVKNDELMQLLPTSGELADLMGRPALVLQDAFGNVRSARKTTLSEPKCLGVVFGVLENDYRASGYSATFGLLGDDADTPFSPDVVVGVTTFGDAAEAKRFVDERSATWRNCTDRPLTERVVPNDSSEPEPTFTWVAAKPAVHEGIPTVTRTLEGGRGFGCARTLAARSNVVADVDVCSPDAADAADHALTLAREVLGNITR